MNEKRCEYCIKRVRCLESGFADPELCRVLHEELDEILFEMARNLHLSNTGTLDITITTWHGGGEDTGEKLKSISYESELVKLLGPSWDVEQRFRRTKQHSGKTFDLIEATMW